jgi:small lipoprotein (TIGR04454 family)
MIGTLTENSERELLMNKITLLLLLLAAFAVGNCKDKSISAAECTPVVEAMFENFKKMAPDSAEEADKKKMMLLPVLQKECESGKFDLACLKVAKDMMALQTCKK